MNNTFNLNIFDYVNKTAPYRFVALAYEKILGTGLIDREKIFVPFELDEHKNLAKSLNDETDNVVFFIENFIVKNGLDKDFCTLLKQKPVLRYLMAIGFHDAKIVEIDCTNKNLIIKIDFTGCMSSPNIQEERCTLKFINAKTNLDDYKEFFIDDFRIEFCNGMLGFKFSLHNRGANLITKKLEIFCEDVILF